MIRFEFFDAGSGPWFAFTPGSIIPNYSGEYGYDGPYRLDVPIGAVSMQPVLITERRLGNRPIYGEKVVGSRRDKEVSHLNATGTIRLPRSTFLEFESVSGYNEYYDTRLKRLCQVSEPVPWGDESVVYKLSTPVRRYLYNGTLRRVEPSLLTTYCKFAGNKMILVSELIRGAVYEELSGKQVAPGGVSSTIRRGYRKAVSGTYQFRYFPILSTTGTYTPAQQQSYLDSITESGGTLHSEMAFELKTTPNTEAVVDEISSRIQAKLGRISLHLDEHPTDFGNLGLECSAQLKFVDENVLLLILDVDDLRNFRKLWKNVVNLEGWRRSAAISKRFYQGNGKWKHIPDALKPAGSAYLFEKYVVKPNVSDVKRLLDGARRAASWAGKQRLHSRKVTPLSDPTASYATHTAVLTVQCDTYPTGVTGGIQMMIGGMKRWGIYPEMVNLWDVLPYSFVADWFVQVGDFLEGVDDYMNQKWYFPIQYCIMSEKWEVGRDINSIAPLRGATGTVRFSYYTRWISRELPLPPVSLSAESRAEKHLLESSALVLGRM